MLPFTQGKPDVRFLITPIPPVAMEQREMWRSKVESWITDNWNLPKGMNVKEVYNEVLYNPDIVNLSSLVNGVPNSLIDAYIPLADTIYASHN